MLPDLREVPWHTLTVMVCHLALSFSPSVLLAQTPEPQPGLPTKERSKAHHHVPAGPSLPQLDRGDPADETLTAPPQLPSPLPQLQLKALLQALH